MNILFFLPRRGATMADGGWTQDGGSNPSLSARKWWKTEERDTCYADRWLTADDQAGTSDTSAPETIARPPRGAAIIPSSPQSPKSSFWWNTQLISQHIDSPSLLKKKIYIFRLFRIKKCSVPACGCDWCYLLKGGSEGEWGDERRLSAICRHLSSGGATTHHKFEPAAFNLKKTFSTTIWNFRETKKKKHLKTRLGFTAGFLADPASSWAGGEEGLLYK